MSWGVSILTSSSRTGFQGHFLSSGLPLLHIYVSPLFSAGIPTNLIIKSYSGHKWGFQEHLSFPEKTCWIMHVLRGLCNLATWLILGAIWIFVHVGLWAQLETLVVLFARTAVSPSYDLPSLEHCPLQLSVTTAGAANRKLLGPIPVCYVRKSRTSFYCSVQYENRICMLLFVLLLGGDARPFAWSAVYTSPC